MKSLVSNVVSCFEEKLHLLRQLAFLEPTRVEGDYFLIANSQDSGTAPRLALIDVSGIKAKPSRSEYQLTIVDCFYSKKLLSEHHKNECSVYFNKKGNVKKVQFGANQFRGYVAPKPNDPFQKAICVMISNYERAIQETESRAMKLRLKESKAQIRNSALAEKENYLNQ